MSDEQLIALMATIFQAAPDFDVDDETAVEWARKLLAEVKKEKP